MTSKTGRGDTTDAEKTRKEIEDLLANFQTKLKSEDLREKVLSLVPVFHALRDLGKALIPGSYASSARDRILYYFQKYPGTVIDGNELLVISGIQEYARRVRELRVQFGWTIVSGVTMKEMTDDQAAEIPDEMKEIKPDQYVLVHEEQDREAAHRWNLANAVRKRKLSARDKILAYFRENVGKPVTNEELRYVAGNITEWARRVRELRTEQGWPVATRTTGRPDLAVGVYVLQSDRQSPEHDRSIPDDVRRSVLRRDKYRCQKCGWTHDEWNPSDPRHLELHHEKPHAKGGKNLPQNLITLCVVCHDRVHRKEN